MEFVDARFPPLLPVPMHQVPDSVQEQHENESGGSEINASLLCRFPSEEFGTFMYWQQPNYYDSIDLPNL